MHITFTFRNTEAEDGLKEYVDKKLSRLERYIDKPVDASVTLSVEKFRNVAEIKLLAKGVNLNGKEEAKEMALAIDNVVDKVERQIKKYKEKTRNHKENSSKGKREDLDQSLPEEFEEDEEQQRISKVMRVVLKPMSVDDAILEMEESKNRFMIFRDASTEKVSVVYRKDDDDYILVETTG
jgi:putative sigma-54 modulation protein